MATKKQAAKAAEALKSGIIKKEKGKTAAKAKAKPATKKAPAKTAKPAEKPKVVKGKPVPAKVKKSAAAPSKEDQASMFDDLPTLDAAIEYAGGQKETPSKAPRKQRAVTAKHGSGLPEQFNTTQKIQANISKVATVKDAWELLKAVSGAGLPVSAVQRVHQRFNILRGQLEREGIKNADYRIAFLSEEITAAVRG